jgi:DNA topoisomerase-2
LDIIQYIKEMLLLPTGEDGLNLKKSGDNNNDNNYDNTFIPYYEGFTGQITKITDSKFLIKGKYEKTGPDKIRITELPIGLWTDTFKEYLESLTDIQTDKSGKKIQAIVKDYTDMSKDTTIDFTIILQKGKLEELESIQLENGCNGLEKQFKLFTTNTTTNMHLFDAHDKLKKYSRVDEIIDDYYETRLNMYQIRKDYLVAAISQELVLLTNKARFIKENLDGSIDLRRKKKEEVTFMLSEKNYEIIDEDDEYKYLTKMPMDSVTEENVDKIMKEHDNKIVELENIKTLTIQQMWLQELEQLSHEYLKYKEDRERTMRGTGSTTLVVKKKIVKIVKA